MDSNGALPLTLRIVTPAGVSAEVRCDTVTLTAADRADGWGGGSVGIRRGHERALIALSSGSVRAGANGRRLFEAVTGPGVASVENDVITVAAEQVTVDTQ